MTLDLYQMDFSLKRLCDLKGKKQMGVILTKIITKLGWHRYCSVTERQWSCPLLRISVIGAGKILVDLRQWKKSTFQGEFTEGVFREHEVHT